MIAYDKMVVVSKKSPEQIKTHEFVCAAFYCERRKLYDIAAGGRRVGNEHSFHFLVVGIHLVGWKIGNADQSCTILPMLAKHI